MLRMKGITLRIFPLCISPSHVSHDSSHSFGERVRNSDWLIREYGIDSSNERGIWKSWWDFVWVHDFRTASISRSRRKKFEILIHSIRPSDLQRGRNISGEIHQSSSSERRLGVLFRVYRPSRKSLKEPFMRVSHSHMDEKKYCMCSSSWSIISLASCSMSPVNHSINADIDSILG